MLANADLFKVFLAAIKYRAASGMALHEWEAVRYTYTRLISAYGVRSCNILESCSRGGCISEPASQFGALCHLRWHICDAHLAWRQASLILSASRTVPICDATAELRVRLWCALGSVLVPLPAQREMLALTMILVMRTTKHENPIS